MWQARQEEDGYFQQQEEKRIRYYGYKDVTGGLSHLDFGAVAASQRLLTHFLHLKKAGTLGEAQGSKRFHPNISERHAMCPPQVSGNSTLALSSDHIRETHMEYSPPWHLFSFIAALTFVSLVFLPPCFPSKHVETIYIPVASTWLGVNEVSRLGGGIHSIFAPLLSPAFHKWSVVWQSLYYAPEVVGTYRSHHFHLADTSGCNPPSPLPVVGALQKSLFLT